MSDNNISGKDMGLKQKLRQSWDERHRLIRHCEQPKIEFTPQQLKGLHQSSKCFKAGFCWCKATPKQDRRLGQDAIQLEQRIIQTMKKLYFVKRTKFFLIWAPKMFLILLTTQFLPGILPAELKYTTLVQHYSRLHCAKKKHHPTF